MAYNKYLTIGDQDFVGADNNKTSLWTYATGEDVLSNMAKSMSNNIGTVVTGRDEITVPSPWSAIITFDILLDNIVWSAGKRSKDIDYGEIQDNAETEWKVLLALIALRKERNIPITFCTVDIDRDMITPKGNEFARNILSQHPMSGIFGNLIKAWSSFTVIKVNNKTIGCLTPTNIVCSTYEFSKDDWLIGNGLMDYDQASDRYFLKSPLEFIVSAGGMSCQASFDYMIAWLDEVLAVLKSVSFFANSGMLRNRLEAYKKEIIGYALNNRPSPMQHDSTNSLQLSVAPEALMNTREIIENIHSEYSWTGLLTAIAFSNLSSYNITFENVELGAKTMYGQNMFHSSVINDPTARAILLDGECIGMVRGRELIAVPTQYGDTKAVHKLIECGIMSNGKEYNDPVKFICKSVQRYIYMTAWIDALINVLGSHHNIDTAALEKITDFKQELTQCRNQFSPIEMRRLEDNKFVTITMKNTGTLVSPFDSVTATLDLWSTGIIDSAKMVGAKIPNLVCFSEATITTDLLNFYRKVDNWNIALSGKLPEIFDEAAVFEEQAFYLETAGSSTKRINRESDWFYITDSKGIVKSYTMIWPINQDMFSMLKSDNIYKGISLSYDRDEGCTITLDIQVGENIVTIAKTYPPPNELNTISASMIAGVSIWPYIDCPEWKAYFIYESKKVLVNRTTNPYSIEYLPAEPGASDMHNTFRNTIDDQTERKIFFRTTLPEYIVIRDNNGGYKGAILFENSDNGTGITKKKITVNPKVVAKTTAEVGIDFGTTSTTISESLGGGPIGIVRFDESSLQQTYEPVRNDESYADCYFISNEYSGLNYYPSILRTLSNVLDPQANPAMDIYPLVYGNIIYDYKNSQPAVQVKDDLQNLHSDMKWDSSGAKIDYIKQYLRQIIMQTMLYMLNKNCNCINWHISYPSSFADGQKQQYIQAVTNVISMLTQQIGAISMGTISNETESTAAGKEIVGSVLHKKQIPYAIVVDIGGGSTDISAWRGGGIEYTQLFQTSVTIASRKIFLNPLVDLVLNDPNLIKTVASAGIPYNNIEKYADTYKNQNNKDSDESVEAKIKIANLMEQFLLVDRNNTLMNMITAQIGNAAVDHFINRIVVGFYAIMFYVIKMLDAQNTKIAGGVVIQLTGNGAKIYDWIKDFYGNQITSILSKMMGCTVDISFNSSNSKTEAARGMLNNIIATASDATVYNGCDITVEYSKNGERQKDYLIDKSLMLSTNEIISSYFNNIVLDGISINNIMMHDDTELVDEFLDQVEHKIFNNAINIHEYDKTEMGNVVQTEMAKSINSRQLTSPLLEQIMYIVNRI